MPNSSKPKQERNYRCQRCSNHGMVTLRKGHICVYKRCVCNLCNLNNERRQINKDITKNRKVQALNKELADNNRLQHCTLCKNHNILMPLKGHKKKCPNRDCRCKPCSDGKKHRKIMAEQTKNRRKQINVTSGNHTSMSGSDTDSRMSTASLPELIRPQARIALSEPPPFMNCVPYLNGHPTLFNDWNNYFPCLSSMISNCRVPIPMPWPNLAQCLPTIAHPLFIAQHHHLALQHGYL